MATKDLEQEVENFYKYYLDNYKTFEKAAEYFRSLLNSLISDDCEIQSITYRVKDKEECVSKFKRKYLEKIEQEGKPYQIKDAITDLIGLRIVCLYETEITKIQDVLNENFKVVEVTDKIKSLDSTENQFGYKSLHIDLKLNDSRNKLPEFKKFADFRFEVQIRTIIQDAWSVLDHKIKYKKSIPPDLKRRINRLAALFEIADDEFFNIKVGTTDFEEKAKTESKPNEPINVLTFLTTASQSFPTYQFLSYKADGFVHELINLKSDLTQKELSESLKNNLDKVKSYNGEIVTKSPANYLNPYTMIRHCLYLSDKGKFSSVLFRVQAETFDEWLKTQKNNITESK
ncbi:MAG: (p)ppGpp synthetase [Bacteroidia bacterium]